MHLHTGQAGLQLYSGDYLTDSAARESPCQTAGLATYVGKIRGFSVTVAEMRAIYAAATLEETASALDRFEASWGDKYPAIGPSWRADWDRLTALFDFPPTIRKLIYTTNAIESLNYSLRKVLKNRGAFPNDESIQKILYLGLHNASKKWNRPIRDWKAALNQFVILFEDRVLV
jgi:putative transposase